MQLQLITLCACGCGQLTRMYRGKQGVFIKFHHRRGTGTPVADRFYSFVDKTYPPPEHAMNLGSCWQWLGSGVGEGYGRFNRKVPGRTRYASVRAHRFSWELRSGAAIPDGFEVLHTCDNRRCVRNDDEGFYVVNGKSLPRFGHLFLGTAADNSIDMVKKDRHPGRTPTPENLRVVLELLKVGVSWRRIAERTNVTESTVQRIKEGAYRWMLH